MLGFFKIFSKKVPYKYKRKKKTFPFKNVFSSMKCIHFTKILYVPTDVIISFPNIPACNLISTFNTIPL